MVSAGRVTAQQGDAGSAGGSVRVEHCEDIPPEDCWCGGDGRTRRRLRNRQAMVTALGELIAKGLEHPTLEDVAEQAGVSTRSVYRHFGTVEEARLEWADEIVRFIVGLVESASGPVLAGAPLDERCTSLVEARLALYDQTGTIARTAAARRHYSDRAAERYEAARTMIESQVPERFASELDALSDSERVTRLGMFNMLVSDVVIDDLVSRCGDRRDEIVSQLAKQLAAALTL